MIVKPALDFTPAHIRAVKTSSLIALTDKARLMKVLWPNIIELACEPGAIQKMEAETKRVISIIEAEIDRRIPI